MEIKIIPFNQRESYRTEVPAIPAIYFFLRKDDNKILYIGSTKNLKMRVKAYVEFRDKTNLAWFECKGNLRKTERDLIRQYKPSLNIRNGPNAQLLKCHRQKRELLKVKNL